MAHRQVENAKNIWFKRGQRRCYCGRQLVWQQGQKNSATFEHMVPKAHGGTYALKNSMIVCSECNNKRGTTCWIEWIQKNNPPKAKWLIKKYKQALEFYAGVDRHKQVKMPMHITIHIKNLTINK